MKTIMTAAALACGTLAAWSGAHAEGEIVNAATGTVIAVPSPKVFKTTTVGQEIPHEFARGIGPQAPAVVPPEHKIIKK